MKRISQIYHIGIRLIACLTLCCWQGCATSDSDDPQTPQVTDGRVTVDLALSVSTVNGHTRMASSVVNPSSLDIDGFEVFPFIIPADQDSITSSDTPQAEVLTDFSVSGSHYLKSDQQLTLGVNAFLCYAKAKHAEGYSKDKDGSLVVTGLGLSSEFALDPITKPLASQVILDYMNSIKDADWSTIPETKESFLNLRGGTYQGLAGSSKNIIAYVNEWLDKAIPDDIKAVIRSDNYVTLDTNNDKVTAINGITTNYPGQFPDGSAVIKYNGSAFVYESYPDYAYPAERYFYANSRIKTSTSSQRDHYDISRWSEKGLTDADGVLDYYDVDNAVVASTTRSVAIKNPLRYGVAGMKIQIKANTGNLGVYDGEPVHLITTMFPLTAVIIGSQVKQNCFFEPANPDEDGNEYLIYDTKTEVEKPSKTNPEYVCLGETNADTYSLPVYTLGLQTKDGVSLKVVLEFENNSGAAFTSENGVIHPGTKFYMVASVVPPGEQGIEKRIMTRGHMTVVKLTIRSLKSAYNALPDLSSDKLRLFDVVEAAIHNWRPGQTGEHEVYNW